jgi:hypothetical protein
MLRFAIRELFLVVLSVAICLGWWQDHRRLVAARNEAAEDARKLALLVADDGRYYHSKSYHQEMLESQDKYGARKSLAADPIALDGYGGWSEGKEYVVVVTKSELEKTPAWTDEDEEPPLPAGRALKLADAMKEKLVQDPKGWKWERYDANLVENTFTNRWFWAFKYHCFPQSGALSGAAPHLDVVVLMDGTAVEPAVIVHERKK